jgi:predicted nucleic acid-binding protein
MNYLLDSDVLIDFLHAKEPGSSLVKQVLLAPTFISIISWSEIMYGINKAENSQKKEMQFLQFLKKARINIVPIDEKIAENFVTIKVQLERDGTRLEDFDLLIAATAIVEDLILVTRNKKHFERIKGLQLFV